MLRQNKLVDSKRSINRKTTTRNRKEGKNSGILEKKETLKQFENSECILRLI